ncbi:MAG: DUF58 domain-containing protein [Desulfuromonadales bacterium]
MSITGMAGMYNIKCLIPALLPPDEIFAGTPTPFRLSIRNTKRFLPSFLIRLEHNSGTSLVVPIIHRNSTFEGNLTLVSGKRGQIPAGHITISSSYPVGFFTRYLTILLDGGFTVFPQLLPMNMASCSGDKQRTGDTARSLRGIDGELERIENYSGREPQRLIHWKLSARAGDLLVKGFGDRSVPPLVIELDQLPGQNSEVRLSQAAWLVKMWVLRRPVGLVINGRTITAAGGRQHGLKLLKELALYGGD